VALQLTHPVKQEFVLFDLDPTGEAKVTFRQATMGDNQIRDTLLFSGQQRVLGEDSVSITNTAPFSVRMEIEVRLTICACEGILKPDGSTLFRFRKDRLAMTPDEFHEAWSMINRSDLAEALWGHCLDVNPDWDWRASRPSEGEDDPNPPTAEETVSG
jgi:hypothetical protein